MDKKDKTPKAELKEINDQESAFEIIELAIDDINVLTKAFQVINTICEELAEDPNKEEEDDQDNSSEHYVH